MIDKFVPSVAEALKGIADGSTVLLAGFGDVGMPVALLDGLIEQGARDLTLVCNAGGREGTALARLLTLGRVRKLVCSFVRPASDAGRLFAAGKLELEIVPQGTLAERIRAGGAGIEGFYTPTAAETELAEGREVREIGGKLCVLERPLRGDVALLDAWEADRLGNLTFRDAQRNFNPVMAMAAELVIAQARHAVALGAIAPEHVHTPGIFVDRVLHVPDTR
jgi:3-oxoadipate CoA-transferase alpha subunit